MTTPKRFLSPRATIIIILLGMGSTPQAQDAVDTTAGETLWPHCAFCHTDDGLGFIRFDAPKIAGQEAWYTERQLRHFLDGQRGYHDEDIPGKQMALYAGPLVTDELIASMAAFIESLPVSPEEPKPYWLGMLGPDRPFDWDSELNVLDAAEPGDVERGKALYTTCAVCHGQNLEGNQALNSPRLDNKQDWYLARQLKYFKLGARGTHPEDIYGQQMAASMAVLPDDQAIVDVVAYIMTMAKGPFN